MHCKLLFKSDLVTENVLEQSLCLGVGLEMHLQIFCQLKYAVKENGTLQRNGAAGSTLTGLRARVLSHLLLQTHCDTLLQMN